MPSIRRECLVCGHGQKTYHEDHEEYEKVTVCPKCNGAFVDRFFVGRYPNRDRKQPLLTIELESETAVPKIVYKGEEIRFKRHVFFDWDTDTSVPGGLTYAIEHYERGEGKGPGAVNRIERRVSSHAT